MMGSDYKSTKTYSHEIVIKRFNICENINYYTINHIILI
jgi:hypothetical protein